EIRIEAAPNQTAWSGTPWLRLHAGRSLHFLEPSVCRSDTGLTVRISTAAANATLRDSPGGGQEWLWPLTGSAPWTLTLEYQW
ncbi:MAG: hypothetical protein AB7F89_09315, partial [Pirellulaceae bacterium]